MRRFAAILFLLGFLFFGGKPARAQYYSWGADAAALRWKHLRTEDVRVVFPDTASALAHRTLYYIQAVRPTIILTARIMSMIFTKISSPTVW